ncbi:MAG: recombinase family protein [Anaerolineales bacterium]
MLPAPGEQVTVSRILALPATGLSLRAIARALDAEGLRARSGQPFGPSTLLGLVRNRAVLNSQSTG